MNFPGLRTYMVAYGDMPSLQQAAARALLGQLDITGKLPISLPGLYARGTGIQLIENPAAMVYRIRPDGLALIKEFQGEVTGVIPRN